MMSDSDSDGSFEALLNYDSHKQMSSSKKVAVEEPASPDSWLGMSQESTQSAASETKGQKRPMPLVKAISPKKQAKIAGQPCKNSGKKRYAAFLGFLGPSCWLSHSI